MSFFLLVHGVGMGAGGAVATPTFTITAISVVTDSDTPYVGGGYYPVEG
jgi:hypothetical protein